MNQEIESENPVIRDAMTNEHNNEDLRTIEELKGRIEILFSKLNEAIDDRDRHMKEVDDLRESLRCMDERSVHDDYARIDLMNAFDHSRRELEETKRENALLKFEMEHGRYPNRYHNGFDPDIEIVLDELIENSEDLVDGLRALCGILMNAQTSISGGE